MVKAFPVGGVVEAGHEEQEPAKIIRKGIGFPG